MKVVTDKSIAIVEKIGISIKLQFFNVEISKNSRVKNLESIVTLDFEENIIDFSVAHGLLAVLFTGSVFIRKLDLENAKLSDNSTLCSNLPNFSCPAEKIEFDPKSKTRIIFSNQTEIAFMNLVLQQKQWILLDESNNIVLNENTGIPEAQQSKKYLSDILLSQADFESDNSFYRVSEEIRKHEDLDQRKYCDTIKKVLSYGLNEIIVLTERCSLYHVALNEFKVTDMVNIMECKKQKVFMKLSRVIETSTRLTTAYGHTNFTQVIDVELSGNGVWVYFSAPGLVVELANITTADSALKCQVVNIEKPLDLELDSKVIEMYRNFTVLESSAVFYREDRIQAGRPNRYNFALSTFISVNENKSWFACLTNDQTLAFLESSSGKYSFSHGFQKNIASIASYTNILVLGFTDGTFKVCLVDMSKTVTILADYKIYDGLSVDILAIDHERILVGTTKSSKFFSFETATQKIEKTCTIIPFQGSCEVVSIRHLAVSNGKIYYSAAPVNYPLSEACIIGLINGDVQSQCITDQSFKKSFTPLDSKIFATTWTTLVFFEVPNGAKNERITFNISQKSILPYTILLSDSSYIEPCTNFHQIDPLVAENGPFGVIESHNYNLITSGKCISMYPNSKSFPQTVHLAPCDYKDTSILLETKISVDKKNRLQQRHEAERHQIKSKLDQLIKKLTELKVENNGVEEVEKIDPLQLVLDRSTISLREQKITLAAEKLESELKERIAVALAKEKKIDLHCDKNWFIFLKKYYSDL